ncbi:hypothetical protein VTH06DRAFT_3011 [Thermothelomyces fergusii]
MLTGKPPTDGSRISAYLRCLVSRSQLEVQTGLGLSNPWFGGAQLNNAPHPPFHEANDKIVGLPGT